MAFNSPVVGDTILHTDITQFVNNWSGVAGFGVAFENIQVNETSKYAGDFQNLDTTNSYGLRVRDSSGNALLTAVLAGCTLSKTTTLSRGTITTDLKVLDASATWNAAGVTFTAMKLNVTDTASAAASLLLDLQVGGTSKLNVTKAGALSVGAALLPVTTDGGAIGSATLMWGDLFLASGAVINFNNGNVTITHAAGQLAVAATLLPSTTDGFAIGSATVMWSDLFLASGGVINFNNGDVTLTHGSNYLNLEGGNLFLGDTANANMTAGITINQGANDDEALALKSSDIAHGVTDYAETDTYLLGKKLSATDGGILLRAFSEGTMAMQLDAVSVTEDTTKSTAGRAYLELQASKKSGTGVGAVGTDANLVSIRNLSTTRFIFDAEGTMHSIGASYSDQIGNGLWFINDTANANMTVGLTINQGAATDQVITVKNSGMAHGMTTLTETDTSGYIKAFANLTISGFGAGGLGLLLEGYGVTDDAAAKGTASTAYVTIRSSKKSGTSSDAVGANANLLTVRNYNSTVFVFDAEGDSHEDGTGWTAYDDQDDFALLEMCNTAMVKSQDPIKQEFWSWAGENARMLQDLKLITFNDDGHHFVNRSKMQELLVGAMRQTGRRLATIEQKLSLLPGGNA